MTEKEFENLKVGDKVWIITDDLNEGTMKVVEIEVCEKDDVNERIKFIGGAYNRDFCYLTEAEAWEKEIASLEMHLEYREEGLKKDRQALYRYKVELAKAKEEESVWVIINEKVYKETPYISFPRTGFQKYATEREAYDALSKFYERKLFKALEKCGYKFAICCDKNIAAVKIAAVNDEFLWGYYYPHLSYGSIRKTNVFDTLEEAEAELERRKRNG